MGLTAAYALIYMALIILLARLLIRSFRLQATRDWEST